MLKKKNNPSTPSLAKDITSGISLSPYLSKELWRWIIPCFAILLYANTINHDYTQDDAIVIYDNMYTTQGISGIPGLLTKDTFHGFFKTDGKSKLVSGGRYRPLTPIMFAVEWQLFGKKPLIGHLMNIVFFALLCFILFYLLDQVLGFDRVTTWSRTIAIVATLIFAAHPIHTEVVANIKGRDEIITLLLSLSAILYTLKSVKSSHIIHHIVAGLLFFLALMSKENAITFLAIVPLMMWSFMGQSIRSSIQNTLPYLLASMVFLIIRTAVLGLDFGGTPMELMNNPYIKVENNIYMPFTAAEKASTIIYTLGKYLLLLVFPHPLTHDYYPRHIEIMSFSHWKVILCILAYLSLITFMILRWKKKNIPSFAIFFFLATLSIVSNIVFPIGTNMSERFLFMPSIAFGLIVAVMSVRYIHKKYGNVAFTAVIGLYLFMLSYQTVSRNMVWKNDLTLFTTDVETSVNSAKVLNAAGGALTTEAANEKDPIKKQQMLLKAEGYLKRAIEIHPNYKGAYLLLGNGAYYQNKLEEAISHYENVLRLDPESVDGANNLAVSLRDAGRKAGEVENKLDKALNYLKKSTQLNPNDYETNRLMGISNGFKNNHAEAIKYFSIACTIEPNIAQAYVNLGMAYKNSGDAENAEIQFRKALQLDPNALNN